MADPIYYFDISKTGKDYIGKKDISLLTNELAVLESIKNILSTEPGERIMYPDFGCGLSQYLFEPIDAVTTISIKATIKNAIWKFEGDRITNLEITVNEHPDLNSIEIIVLFNVKTTSKPQTLVLSLNKIR